MKYRIGKQSDRQLDILPVYLRIDVVEWRIMYHSLTQNGQNQPKFIPTETLLKNFSLEEWDGTGFRSYVMGVAGTLDALCESVVSCMGKKEYAFLKSPSEMRITCYDGYWTIRHGLELNEAFYLHRFVKNYFQGKLKRVYGDPEMKNTVCVVEKEK